jgi:hypothetical protein
MRKIVLLLLLPFFVSSCVSLHSVTDTKLEKPYDRVLFYGHYDNRTKRLYKKIELFLATKFDSTKTKIDFSFTYKNDRSLRFDNDSSSDGILAVAKSKNDDLILLLVPTRMMLQNYNTSIQNIDFVISGIDIKSGKEVWKSQLYISSIFGVSFEARNASKKLFLQLKNDRIIY